MLKFLKNPFFFLQASGHLRNVRWSKFVSGRKNQMCLSRGGGKEGAHGAHTLPPWFLATGWLWWVAWHFLFWTQEWLGHAGWGRGGGPETPLCSDASCWSSCTHTGSGFLCKGGEQRSPAEGRELDKTRACPHLPC